MHTKCFWFWNKRRFVNEGVIDIDYSFSASGIYKTIEAGSREDYIAYINTLPLVPKPEAFGMHDNAEITTNQNDTRTILELTLSVQPRTSSGGGMSREDQIDKVAKMIESKTPAIIDLDEVSEKYPTEYTESMNTVLCQEIVRYNALLNVMVVMLRDV
jgi:dynein heavy chain